MNRILKLKLTFTLFLFFTLTSTLSLSAQSVDVVINEDGVERTGVILLTVSMTYPLES